MKQLFAIALLVSACGGTVQPNSTTAASPSPIARVSAEASSAPVASDSGYLGELNATLFRAEAAARGLSCEEYASQDQPTQQVWSCSGHAADGSELLMSAQGPDGTRLVYATAEVLGNKPVTDETVLQFLGPMSKLYAGADGARAQAWLVAALSDAQRDGYVETDIGDNHFRLRYDDNGAGTPSATYLLVVPASAR